MPPPHLLPSSVQSTVATSNGSLECMAKLLGTGGSVKQLSDLAVPEQASFGSDESESGFWMLVTDKSTLNDQASEF